MATRIVLMVQPDGEDARPLTPEDLSGVLAGAATDASLLELRDAVGELETALAKDTTLEEVASAVTAVTAAVTAGSVTPVQTNLAYVVDEFGDDVLSAWTEGGFRYTVARNPSKPSQVTGITKAPVT